MSGKRLKKRPVVIIDCPEEIPCNPCETVCSQGAIIIGQPITNLPVTDEAKCTGCGRCIPVCPGLAISLLHYDYSPSEASLTVPYEFLPLPKKGQEVFVVDEKGRYLGKGNIIRVIPPEKNNRTSLVTFSFSKKLYKKVKYFVLKRENLIDETRKYEPGKK
ncbi:MAG: 4Fe-4S binding protein [Candidatus Omnitrophica bacterium]|nr:4Fe-4S binding protein [Candidatus Omnitrophota bacterium]